MSSLRHSSSRISNICKIKNNVIAAIEIFGFSLVLGMLLLLPSPFHLMSTKRCFEKWGGKYIYIVISLFVLGCKSFLYCIYWVYQKAFIKFCNGLKCSDMYCTKYLKPYKKLLNPEGNNAAEKTLFTVSCLEIKSALMVEVVYC